MQLLTLTALLVAATISTAAASEEEGMSASTAQVNTWTACGLGYDKVMHTACNESRQKIKYHNDFQVAHVGILCSVSMM